MTNTMAVLALVALGGCSRSDDAVENDTQDGLGSKGGLVLETPDDPARSHKLETFLRSPEGESTKDDNVFALAPIRDDSSGLVDDLEITVHLSGESAPSIADGLILTLEIRNDSDREIDLFSPIDMVQVQLLDAKGWPITPRRTRPASALINTRSPIPEDSHLGMQERLVGGAQLINRSHHGPPTLRLPCGGQYFLEIEVRYVTPADPQAKEPEQKEPCPIVPGDYQVRLTMTVVESSAEQGSRLVMQSDFLPVVVRQRGR